MRKKWSLILPLILLVTFLDFSSTEASIRQDIRYIKKSGDQLYLLTGEWDIKIYDLNDRKVIRAIELPDKDKGRKGGFYIMAVVEGDDTLYIQAGAREFEKTHIYQFKDEKVIQLGVLPPFNRIVGADIDYIYVTDGKSSERGFRYDKQFNNRMERHFEDYPGLVITDIWEGSDKNWYAGVIKPSGKHPEILKGKPFLLSKDKRSERSVLYDIGAHDFFLSYHRGLSITEDVESIWIVGAEEHDGSSIYKILQFSKDKGILERNERPLLRPNNFPFEVPFSGVMSLVKERINNKNIQFLWFVSSQLDEIFRFDKQTFKLTSFASQDEATPLKSNESYFPYFNSSYMADENYIWMGINEFKHEGQLLRISKADTSYEVVPVFSKKKKIVKGIALYSIVAVLILSPILSLILGFSNIPKLKHLKGWTPTVAVIVPAVLLVILGPIFEDFFDSYGLFLAIPLLGFAPILLSRCLTYLVKLTRFKKISWAITASLSLFSGGLFILLFFVTYRFVSGEAGWGLLVIAAWGTPIVSFISLIVNIRERIS
jgi:hypothetical protein